MKITIPRLLAVAVSIVLTVYVFVLAPQLHSSAGAGAGKPVTGALALPKPAIRSGHSPGVFPSRDKKFIGIMTSGGPYNFAALDEFTKATSYHPAVYEFGQSWAENQFNRGIIDQVARRGMLPMISWDPWDYRRASQEGNQPNYRLSSIIDGDYDAYIRSWAEGVKSLGYTIAIRFAHEMNSNWYPWGVYTNGNTTSQYVQAWRHVHDIFTEAGTANVIWVWSPNIIWNNSTNLARLYPGNAYVDWIGLSGYYGTPGLSGYESFNQLFTRTITELRTFTGKPLVITETGATNTEKLMARWVTQMFQQLPAHAGIIGVIWFEAADAIDWRIADHPAAARAFAKGAASPRYQVRWKPGKTPLLKVPLPRGPSPSPAVSAR